MSIESSTQEFRVCPCGCGQGFSLFSGLMSYGKDDEVLFRAAHMQHGGGDPHLWMLLGSGPWFDDDECGCWVVLHVWVNETNLVTRVEDAEESPFTKEDIFEERFVSRTEVLERPGALDWAIERREQFVREHEPTSSFILQSHVGQRALGVDGADGRRQD